MPYSTMSQLTKQSKPDLIHTASPISLQGISEAVLMMPVGAKWKLTMPGDLAFLAGRPASPGKARIPAGATLDYILELTGLPGKEEDLIEVIGDV